MSIQLTATFDVLALRFRFRANRALAFPPGTAGNFFRGQFGKALKRRADDYYSQFFAPVSPDAMGPSGLHDPPRPFVFRVRHLEGKRIALGEVFQANMNLFDVRDPAAALC